MCGWNVRFAMRGATAFTTSLWESHIRARCLGIAFFRSGFFLRVFLSKQTFHAALRYPRPRLILIRSPGTLMRTQKRLYAKAGEQLAIQFSNVTEHHAAPVGEELVAQRQGGTGGQEVTEARKVSLQEEGDIPSPRPNTKRASTFRG